MQVLLESSARAILLSAGVAITLTMLRIRSPRIAHRAWVGVALALIALPAIISGGAELAIPIADAPARWTAPGLHPLPLTAMSGVDEAPARVRPAPSSRPWRWGPLVLVVYLTGVVLLLARVMLGVREAAAIRRGATLVDGRLTSPRCSTPLTVGLRKAVVILPPIWTSWPQHELAAVLAHEEEHVRCRDPLAASITLIARAVFWFHPLAWWLPRHVARLSEQACDASVLARGHDADLYAASLVKFARAQAAAGCRVAPPGIAMGGVALERRLRVLQGPQVPAAGSARLLAAAGIYAVALVVCSAGTPTAVSALAAAPPAQSDAVQASAAAWLVTTTEHFEIHHRGEQPDVLAETTRQAEDAYAELSAAFKYDLAARVPIVLVRGPTDPPADPASIVRASGVQAGRQAIVMHAESLETPRRLMVHELTHSFAFEIVPEPSRHAPWLMEGLAEHQRGVWDAGSVRAVRDAVASTWIPTVDALASAERFWAHAFFDFIADAHGPEGIRRYLFALRTRPRIVDAIPAAFGTDGVEFDRAFRRYVSGRFGTL